MIKEKLLPIEELKLFGIYKDGKFTIPEDQVKALQEGRMTDVVELKNLKSKDTQIDRLPARLSIVKGTDGNPTLRIDPVYRSPNSHPRLTHEEKERLIKGEIFNVRKNYVDRLGDVRTEIIAYDKDTRQFMSYDPREVPAPETVNNQKLSSEQKRKYKEGEVVELQDGTRLQYATEDRKGIRANRKGLVMSILLDGGLSYLLVTGIRRMLGMKSSEEQSYAKGYQDGLKKMQQHTERRIALKPDEQGAVRDLNMIKGELSKVAAADSTKNTQKYEVDDKHLGTQNSEDVKQNSIKPEGDDRNQRRI